MTTWADTADNPEECPMNTAVNRAIIRVAADGSPGSRRAFEWAMDEARLRGCGVELVAAYQVGTDATHDQARQRAERAVHDTMDEALAADPRPPAITWLVVEGEPADVLVHESAQSQLLVMGSHDVSGMVHSGQPSVTDLCARMADCPVVIVPPARTNGLAGEELVVTGTGVPDPA
jgi:nucleotide-binding universal stress UspA family protein